MTIVLLVQGEHNLEFGWAVRKKKGLEGKKPGMGRQALISSCFFGFGLRDGSSRHP